MTTKADAKNGLQWRTRKGGQRIAYWCALPRHVKAGYSLKTQRLWTGAAPTEADLKWISDECARLQQEMVEWAQESTVPKFDGTVRSLSRLYQTDPESPFHELRYATRNAYVDDLKIIERTVGDRVLSKLTGNDFRRWYKSWRKPKKPDGPERIRRAHGVMVMFRLIINWGITAELDECVRIAVILSKQRFGAPTARTDRLTWSHAKSIVDLALSGGKSSIALAQAMQADCAMRQKDLIGEWVPISEPGLSAVIRGDEKWLRGARWDEINAELIFAHETSKRDQTITHDLKLCPLVMQVLAAMEERPSSGPLILDPETALPYRNKTFYNVWRDLADRAGVPRHVWNMDSRAGALTEGHDAGAEIEALRQTAGHRSAASTGRYNRTTVEKSRKVAKLRSAYRAENGS